MGSYTKKIFKLILGVLVLLITVNSCTVVKPIAVQDSTFIQYHYIDSVRFIDSTVYHNLYKEYYNDYAGLLDTLNLETTYSKAQAYVDTTNKLLKGSIENKNTSVPVQIKWKEKIVYRDSIVYQKEEVPIPVEVPVKYIPKFYKFCLIWFIASVLGIAAIIYIKFFL